MSSKLPLTQFGEPKHAPSPAFRRGYRSYQPSRDQLRRRQLEEETAHWHGPRHLGDSRWPVIGQVQKHPAAPLRQQVRPAGPIRGTICIRKRGNLERGGQRSANSGLRDFGAKPIHLIPVKSGADSACLAAVPPPISCAESTPNRTSAFSGCQNPRTEAVDRLWRAQRIASA